MASLLIPTALRAFTDRKSEIEVAARTAGEAVAALAEAYPDIKQHLYEDGGALRSFINVFVGETNIKSLNGLDTPIDADATVVLVPAIAGGVR
ncbi:MAG: MoaD/ThiS family protein [Oscillospiraceae bacterium]|jgi:adenylyltransferase/sulfurtransferase|nr:MoaD/ThiS family protein [Oscillospiraceae bacterium]